MDNDNPTPDDNKNDNKSGSRLFVRKTYKTDAEKKRDFWLGVGLFFGLNILLGLCSWGLTTAIYNMAYTPQGTNTQFVDLYSIVSCIMGILPLLLNIGLIIYFAFTRSQIAYGMLTGFGIALLIVIILGVIFTVWCFVSLGSGGY